MLEIGVCTSTEKVSKPSSLSQPIMGKGMHFNEKLRAPRIIRLGSDCSGLDSAHFSLVGLGAPFINKFTSDILPEAQLVQENTSKPEKIHPDMLARKVHEETEVDVYVWTPPCQDLSAAGKGAGFEGQRQTGKLVARSLAFIKRRRPRLTIMEEVPRILAKKNRAKLLGILKALKRVGYKLYWKKVNANNCNVPQDRIRFFGDPCSQSSAQVPMASTMQTSVRHLCFGAVQ